MRVIVLVCGLVCLVCAGYQDSQTVSAQASSVRKVIQLARAPGNRQSDPARGKASEVPLTRLSSTIAPGAVLSESQLDLLDKFGTPESFVATFTKDDPDKPNRRVRCESWRYYKYGAALHFIDGELLAVEDLEPLPEPSLPGYHRPDLFKPGQKPNDLTARLEGLGKVKITVPDEFITGTELYAHDQLVLAFQDGELAYAESIVLTPESDIGVEREKPSNQGAFNHAPVPLEFNSLFVMHGLTMPPPKRGIGRALEFLWMKIARPRLWKLVTESAPQIHVLVALAKSHKSRERVRKMCDDVVKEAADFRKEFLAKAKEAHSKGDITRLELQDAERRADKAEQKMKEIADAGRRLAAEEFRKRLTNEIMAQFRETMIHNAQFKKMADKWQDTFSDVKEKINKFKEDLSTIRQVVEGNFEDAIQRVVDIDEKVKEFREIVQKLPDCTFTDNLFKDIDGLQTRIQRCHEQLKELKPRVGENLPTEVLSKELGSILEVVEKLDASVTEARTRGATLGPRALESIVDLYKNDPNVQRLQGELDKLKLPMERVQLILYTNYLARELEKAGVSQDDPKFTTILRVLGKEMSKHGIERLRLIKNLRQVIELIMAEIDQGKFKPETDDEDFETKLEELGIDVAEGSESRPPTLVEITVRQRQTPVINTRWKDVRNAKREVVSRSREEYLKGVLDPAKGDAEIRLAFSRRVRPTQLGPVLQPLKGQAFLNMKPSLGGRVWTGVLSDQFLIGSLGKHELRLRCEALPPKKGAPLSLDLDPTTLARLKDNTWTGYERQGPGMDFELQSAPRLATTYTGPVLSWENSPDTPEKFGTITVTLKPDNTVTGAWSGTHKSTRKFGQRTEYYTWVFSCTFEGKLVRTTLPHPYFVLAEGPYQLTETRKDVWANGQQKEKTDKSAGTVKLAGEFGHYLISRKDGAIHKEAIQFARGDVSLQLKVGFRDYKWLAVPKDGDLSRVPSPKASFWRNLGNN